MSEIRLILFLDGRRGSNRRGRLDWTIRAEDIFALRESGGVGGSQNRWRVQTGKRERILSLNRKLENFHTLQVYRTNYVGTPRLSTVVHPF